MEIKKKLNNHLEECHKLLEDNGEGFWKFKIEKVILMLEKSYNYEHLPDEVLSWFGGMGSFNDLILCNENGHKVDDIDASNKKLSELREKISKTAKEYKKHM